MGICPCHLGGLVNLAVIICTFNFVLSDKSIQGWHYLKLFFFMQKDKSIYYITPWVSKQPVNLQIRPM